MLYSNNGKGDMSGALVLFCPLDFDKLLMEPISSSDNLKVLKLETTLSGVVDFGKVTIPL